MSRAAEHNLRSNLGLFANSHFARKPNASIKAATVSNKGVRSNLELFHLK